MKSFRIAIAAAMLVTCVYAQYGQPGSFLRFGSSARSLGMGGAYSTVVANGDALLYNPAGLANVERWELTLTHAQLFETSRYEFASFSLPVSLTSGIGIALADFGSSDFEKRDDFGTAQGTFGMHDLGVIAGYGQWVMQRQLRVGGSAKFILNSVDDKSAMGFGGVDVGVITKDVFRSFRFGLSVMNIAALDIAGDKLPMTIRAGVGYKMLRSLYLLADVDYVGGAIKPHIGAEYKLSRLLNLRAGYNMSEVTFGLGLALDRLIPGLANAGAPTLDYSAGVMNPVGNDFARVSLSFRGSDKTPPPPPPKASICDELSKYDGALDKDGLVGAKANILNGYCQFIFESEQAPLATNPNMKGAHEFFNEAYVGKFGSQWPQALMTTEGASAVFSQLTHYMFAESRMHKEITEQTKTLVQNLIMVGGDSTVYDARLQYDLAYTYEMLGYVDSARAGYGTLAAREAMKGPIRALSLYRLAYLLRESAPDSAITLLDKTVRLMPWGFFNENGERVSYPMFPKYKDNMLADDALLLMGDIYAAKGGNENTQNGLRCYLDILIFYADAEGSVVRAAAERAANAYSSLGMTEEAQLMRARAGAI